MPRVPFIGRLFLHEYFALITSFLLLGLEVVIRTATLLLPSFVIRFFYRISRNAFNSLSSPHSRRNRNKKKSVSTAIAHAEDFVELCDLYGYQVEEHVVQTGDGYLLGVHRLGWKKGEEEERINAGPGSKQKKVVYLHHGLMMNSEVWVCMTEKERCLPFLLVDQGYDVWLGNNRGNKYCRKSLHHRPTDTAFWDFSMDQFAFYDIPDSINYVLATTHQTSLSYIGFSQGTAQAFAALSIHPALNEKVDVFIALAPAMAPPGIASGVVSSLVKASPEVLFLAFGRKALLGSATMWQTLLYPGIFVYVLDKSLSFLFNWKTRNIPAHQKLAAYPHLYSFTSTKSVVHWFQIIRNRTFQMFDDEAQNPLQTTQSSKYFKAAQFPTRQIKTPIVLVYGGSDSLVDIKLMLKKLPRHTIARGIQKYEHLDLLWAGDVDKLVFPHVLDALDSFASPDGTKDRSGWKALEQGIADRASLTGSQPPGYSEDESRRRVKSTPRTLAEEGDITVDEQLDESEDDDEEEIALPETPEPACRAGVLPKSNAGAPKEISSPRHAVRRSVDEDMRRPGSPLTAAALTEESFESRRSRPEGWWSSTDSTAESSPVREHNETGTARIRSTSGKKAT
ncbi:hypothetical protein AMS68_000756 [Peltaster fructicola]|uniref:Partial AB-hydrolase lipase domain-containing protein n=1 Tax=Peltaster fructicola TaxID=286661 RepID=A0A6H0XKT1_9PEZI|nr:hypothetical protein AMS68_000756 [Peltaster fructicola]